MKGLKKLALVSAIAAVPFAAQADMKALDAAAMGSVTGQSGISIELGANIKVGEVAYQDEGFLAINGLQLAGSDVATNPEGSRLDNILMLIDVAGETNTALSDAHALGEFGVIDPRVQAPAIEDGDLVIRLTSNDHTVNGDAFHSVDFGLKIDSVGLAKSTAAVGNLANEQGTVLVSDLLLTGFLGPVDIVIQENVGAGTQVMNINAYFNVEGQITAPFIGTSFGFAMHDKRGQQLLFAHAQLDIGTREVDDGSGNMVTDGLVVNVQDFSGDIDMTDITFGKDAGRAAIGSMYMTDVQVQAEMVIYGH